MILESCHIDHTNLRPTATRSDILRLCNEAIDYGFRGVCIHPYYVSLANSVLRKDELIHNIPNRPIKVVTVVGFPLGANLSRTKVFETKLAIEEGADEIDVVWNLGLFKMKKYLKVLEQLGRVMDAAKSHTVKVIVESCYLNLEEIEKAYQIVRDSGADYIKTSTGFALSGAQTLVVRTWNQLREQNQDNLKIKAAGGIRDFQTAQSFLDCGADVIGTSHSLKIMREKNASSKLSDY